MIDERMEQVLSRLERASAVLQASAEEIVSIKIRPTDRVPGISDGWLPDRYVFDKEYGDIARELARQFDSVSTLPLGHETARLCEGFRGKVVVVEHETGPELIASLALLTSILGFCTALVNLTVTIMTVISDRNQQRGTTPDGTFDPESGRCTTASGLSVELRTTATEQRCAGAPLPLPMDHAALEEEIRDAIFATAAWDEE